MLNHFSSMLNRFHLQTRQLLRSHGFLSDREYSETQEVPWNPAEGTAADLAVTLVPLPLLRLFGVYCCCCLALLSPQEDR